MKKLLLGMGTMVVVVSPIAMVLSCGENIKVASLKPGYVNGRTVPMNNYDKFVEESKDFTKYSSKERDLIKIADEADINLFFNSWGTITFTYMLRLAVQTKTEVHYGLVHGAGGLAHQDKVNVPEFNRFLKTQSIKGDPTNKDVFPNSEAFTVGADIYGNTITKKWLDIIRKNPTKKINVYWNSDHLDHMAGGDISPMDLAGFKNVNLILLEDGAVVGSQIWMDQNLKNCIDKYSEREIRGLYQQYIPMNYDNVKSFISSKTNVDRLNSFGMDFYYLDPSELFEGLFNTRDKNNSRLMSEWPKVSGLDWHDAKKTLDEVSKNGKPSMILLGSYGVDEKPFLEGVYKKYGQEYNLFYKGHPGHLQWNDYVEHHYADKIHLLDPMISSEELTRDNAKEGMYFDKAACVGQTSAVVGGFKNGINDITHDLLAVYVNGKLSFNNEEDGGDNSEIAKALGAYWAQVVAQK